MFKTIQFFAEQSRVVISTMKSEMSRGHFRMAATKLTSPLTTHVCAPTQQNERETTLNSVRLITITQPPNSSQPTRHYEGVSVCSWSLFIIINALRMH